MKKIVYSFSCLVLAFLMIFLCGCNEKLSLEAYKETKNKQIAGEASVSNDRYTLEWNNKRKTVVLRDNSTGDIWSPIPEDVLNNNKIETGIVDHPQTESPIIVRYYDTTTYIETKAISATSAIKNGRVNAKKNKNGFEVVYDFKSENITVTVDYILNDDGMSIEIDPNKITENPDRIVTSIDVAPYFCSVKNGIENGYVFVPSGSGALIYPEVNMSNPSETNEPVYGTDLSVYNPYDFTNKKSVRMPVYGSVYDGKGVFAIIEEGAASSNICTVSNDSRVKYTTVYANFAVRGYETVDIPKGVKLQNSTGKVYSDPLCDRKISIRYIPLLGSQASYYGMADIYRSYLMDEYGLKVKSANQAVVLRILGGVMTTEFNFGIPNDVLYPLTTVQQAQKLINSSTKQYEDAVRFVLDGYGTTGLEVGELGGGFKISGRLGSNGKLKKLISACEKAGVDISMNFDLLRFNKSSAGFSKRGDTAVAATGKRVVQSYTLLSTKMQTDIYGRYYLLSRNEISKATDKLLRLADSVSLGAVMLDTLSNTLYSDYNFKNYYAKGGEDDIVSAVKALTDSGVRYIASDANIYTAVLADYIDNAPLYSSDYDCFATDVPFYQIVLKGIVPMYSPKWPSATNEREILLKSIETGIGISMSMAENHSDVVFSSPQKQLFAIDEDNYFSHMKELYDEEFFKYYSSVKDAKIVGHTLLCEDVRKTVFDNGKTVFVNYTNTDYVVGDLRIPANGYVVVG